ncbi:MAG: hypothetical protein HFJ28_06740 [Clostridia bacterium]|nr:hypothetical protein [Clostridia bacterium]
MDKLLKKLWSVIEFILVLLIWPAIVLLSFGIAIILNIPMEVAVKYVVGSLIVLVGIYSVCNIRVILKKSKAPKIFIILLGWIGPLSLIVVSVSIMLN